MKMIIGKKIEMSQRFKEDGTVIPVTLVLAPPMSIVQIKIKEKDGYSAVQLGAFPKKKLNKAEKGHLKDLPDYGTLKEFRLVKADESLEKGEELTVEQFEIGDNVNVVGTSKGHGFQGVVKRHRFHGSPASHGHKDQLRMPGSIGATGPAKVFKGMRMPGQMGNKGVTVKNLEIVEVDKEKNIIAVKGAIPGVRNSLVYIESN
ncbi:50S ribosomal protein L3 [Patescibacteria group bacterium]|nr:50S ribosomal protein L3 [Patescibacteria group bacterium]